MIHHRSARQVRLFDIFKVVVVIILLLLLLILWQSCQPGELAAPTEPTATPAEAAQEPEATPEQATDTPTAQPEATVEPTATPEPTPTPEPQPTATEVSPTATPEPPAMAAPTLKLPAGEVPPGDIDLSGTGEPGVEVEVLVEGQVVGKTTVGSDGNWGLTIQLDEAGDYEVMVQALDSAGQVATASDPAVLSVIKPQAEATPTATATPAPAATPAPSGPEDGSAYIVQADDWLSKLAAKFYGDMFAYPVIVEATNAKAAEDSSFTVITNPDLIEIGQKVWIPNQP